jgi:hypothetical protein
VLQDVCENFNAIRLLLPMYIPFTYHKAMSYQVKK